MPKVILIALILCTAFNGASLSLQILNHQLKPSQAPLHTLGDRFKGLETVFTHQRVVGYYTDKNIEDALVVAQYEQAQYLLAPTVLDINHTDHPFVIFDCSSPEVAIRTIKDLGLQPIKANNLGIVLAINPSMKTIQP